MARGLSFTLLEGVMRDLTEETKASTEAQETGNQLAKRISSAAAKAAGGVVKRAGGAIPSILAGMATDALANSAASNSSIAESFTANFVRMASQFNRDATSELSAADKTAARVRSILAPIAPFGDVTPLVDPLADMIAPQSNRIVDMEREVESRRNRDAVAVGVQPFPIERAIIEGVQGVIETIGNFGGGSGK